LIWTSDTRGSTSAHTLYLSACDPCNLFKKEIL
jgi:hypothetical protein